MARLRHANQPFNPNAVDGDGDGVVQEQTLFERPAGSRIVSKVTGKELPDGSPLYSINLNEYRVEVRGSDGEWVEYRQHTFPSTSDLPVGVQRGTLGDIRGTIGHSRPTIAGRSTMKDGAISESLATNGFSKFLQSSIIRSNSSHRPTQNDINNWADRLLSENSSEVQDLLRVHDGDRARVKKILVEFANSGLGMGVPETTSDGRRVPDGVMVAYQIGESTGASIPWVSLSKTHASVMADRWGRDVREVFVVESHLNLIDGTILDYSDEVVPESTQDGGLSSAVISIYNNSDNILTATEGVEDLLTERGYGDIASAIINGDILDEDSISANSSSIRNFVDSEGGIVSRTFLSSPSSFIDDLSVGSSVSVTSYVDSDRGGAVDSVLSDSGRVLVEVKGARVVNVGAFQNDDDSFILSGDFVVESIEYDHVADKSSSNVVTRVVLAAGPPSDQRPSDPPSSGDPAKRDNTEEMHNSLVSRGIKGLKQMAADRKKRYEEWRDKRLEQIGLVRENFRVGALSVLYSLAGKGADGRAKIIDAFTYYPGLRFAAQQRLKAIEEQYGVKVTEHQLASIIAIVSASNDFESNLDTALDMLELIVRGEFTINGDSVELALKKATKDMSADEAAAFIAEFERRLSDLGLNRNDLNGKVINLNDISDKDLDLLQFLHPQFSGLVQGRGGFADTKKAILAYRHPDDTSIVSGAKVQAFYAFFIGDKRFPPATFPLDEWVSRGVLYGDDTVIVEVTIPQINGKCVTKTVRMTVEQYREYTGDKGLVKLLRSNDGGIEGFPGERDLGLIPEITDVMQDLVAEINETINDPEFEIDMGTLHTILWTNTRTSPGFPWGNSQGVTGYDFVPVDQYAAWMMLSFDEKEKILADARRAAIGENIKLEKSRKQIIRESELFIAARAKFIKDTEKLRKQAEQRADKLIAYLNNTRQAFEDARDEFLRERKQDLDALMQRSDELLTNFFITKFSGDKPEGMTDAEFRQLIKDNLSEISKIAKLYFLKNTTNPRNRDVVIPPHLSFIIPYLNRVVNEENKRLAEKAQEAAKKAQSAG